MFLKTKKAFTGWNHSLDQKKGIQNLENIIKHSGLSVSEQYKARKNIIANIEKIQQKTGKAINVKDFEKKILPGLSKSKIIDSTQAKTIYNLAKLGRLPKPEPEKNANTEKTAEIKEVPQLNEESQKTKGWLERLMGIKNKISEQDKNSNSRFGGAPKEPYAKNNNQNSDHSGHETLNPTSPERRTGLSRQTPANNNLPRGGNPTTQGSELPR